MTKGGLYLVELDFAGKVFVVVNDFLNRIQSPEPWSAWCL